MQQAITMIVPAALISLSTFALFTGCDRREKVVDIETPNRQLSIEKDKDTGDVDIKVDRQ